MWPQREARGALVRRMSTDRTLPLACPQEAGLNPVWEEGNGPTKDGSRRAKSGSSIGGGRSIGVSSASAWSMETNSTPDSPPVVLDVALSAGVGVGVGLGTGSPNPGGNRDSGCCASAGMVIARTAANPAAAARSLAGRRVTADFGLDRLGWHLTGARRQIEGRST